MTDETERADADKTRAMALGFMRSQMTKVARAADPAPARPARSKQPLRFEDLPEYKLIEAHRLAGKQLGIADPFHRMHQAAAGATTTIDGRDMINFASYDYLGLNRHPEVTAQAGAALDRYAVSASASRLVGGERPIHDALERRIAELYGVEEALVFVSGYLTNVATIGCLMDPEDVVVHDEFIHNSVLAGIKLSGAARRFFRHNDLDSLRTVLDSVARRFRRVLVVVEGLYSMDGDLADLPGLVRLREEYGFWLMVDEAHALGVLGERGRGSLEHFGCGPEDVDIRMGTLSKASASCGGYVAGSRGLIAILKGTAGGFVYSVGLPPVLAAAALAGLVTMQREPERVARLRENGGHFLGLAQQAGLNTGLSGGYSVIPVIVGDSVRAAKLSDELFAEGVNVLPIIHPAVPEGLARLRFFVTSEHTAEQIEAAVRLTAEHLERIEHAGLGVGSVDLDSIARQVG